MKIQITNLQKTTKIKKSSLKKIIKKIIFFLNIEAGALSFVFTDNKHIRGLNKKYFNRDRATDVICFNLHDKADPCNTLGEIIISVEQALKNSKRFSVPADEELMLYIIHGMLHLLGFKDKTDFEKNIMEAKEKKVFSSLDLKQEKILNL